MTESCRFASAAPEETHVYGACAPGWDREAAETVPEWITLMQSRGIERVCCLLSDRQLEGYGDLLAEYRDAFGPDRVAHVPVADHTLMNPETLTNDVVPLLEAAVDANEPVVVHCMAGIGRTGQVLAAWLVHHHGYDPEAAVETVVDRGRQPDEAVRAGHATEAELSDLLESVAQ